MKNILYNDIDLNITQEDRVLLNELLSVVKSHNNYLDTYGNSKPARDDEVFFQSFIRQLDVDYRSTNLFQKLFQLFSPVGLDVYAKAQIVKITGSLVPHVDARSCVLTIPLENTKYPITWYNDDDSVLYQYFYSNPVLINTHVRHGCVENTADRYLFQVGVDSQFGDFDKINNLLTG